MTDDAALDVLRAAAPANADTLDDLRDRLSLASAIPLVPFVGAGLSQPMGFPLWRGFLEGLAGECGAAEETRGLLDAGEFESAAEAVELALSPELFHRRLAQRFGKRKSAGCALRGPMLALPSLPVGPVVTTNFDGLLERVFEESGRPLRVCAGAQVDAIREAIADNQPILLKLHGSAEERTNRILTRAEYERHYGTGDPGNLRAQLAGIFQGRRLLFLGCSLGKDRTMDVLAGLLGQSLGQSHFAIVERPLADADFHARQRELGNRGILPVWYPAERHDLIEPFLRWMASLRPAEPGPAVGRRRGAGAVTVRDRAVRLLEEFFGTDGEWARRTVFRRAFAGISPDPCREIRFGEAQAVFAGEAVDRLLDYGCAAPGRHCLSMLLAAMGEMRGRRDDPEIEDLQRELDVLCALLTREVELVYLKRLMGEIEEKARLYSPLQAVEQKRGKAERLFRPWQGDAGLALLRHQVRKRGPEETGAEAAREYGDILEAFGQVRRAALLGAPGSGKSTTLRKLAYDLAERAQADATAPLPVLAAMGEWRGEESLAEFLAGQAPEIGRAVKALSRAGRLALLLDGINEMATARRGTKAAEVSRFREGADASTAFFVSCRREDYVGELDLGLDTLTLEPLTPARIRSAVRHWMESAGKPVEAADRFFWQLAGDVGLAAVWEKWRSAGASLDEFWSVKDPKDHKAAYGKTSGTEDELWRRHVPNPRSLMKLAANPFMLTMLFWVGADGELPQNRGELFRLFIYNLLGRERLAKADAESKVWRLEARGERLLEGLNALAWRMQQLGSGSESGVLTVASRADAVAALGDEGLLKASLDATLLEGGEEVRFRHQLLQEYFTAQALRARMAKVEARELWPVERWWERSGWEETAVLLAGLHADDCGPVIRWLAEAQPETAAQCIAESGAEIADRAGLLRELQAAWMARLCDVKQEPQPEGRAAVGRALGRLGLDTRKGVGLAGDGLPDIDWVEIPGGEFEYQEEKKRRRIQTFRIGRYPVTNAQFQAFLDAKDGYRDDRWWEGLSTPDRQTAAPAWSEANHPRERVSWHEAMAFCAWLSHKLGREISLPTEWEWERAARGTDGRAYPWGAAYVAGYANIDESYGEAGPHKLGRTSAVGIYPQGASAEGVMDLSGNVWEWCLNEYQKPARIQREGAESRVLRGGSWDDSQEYARADYRFGYAPDSRSYYFGFRVVWRSPIR